MVSLATHPLMFSGSAPECLIRPFEKLVGYTRIVREGAQFFFAVVSVVFSRSRLQDGAFNIWIAQQNLTST